MNRFFQKVANASTAGRRELPDWPDWEECVGLGWPWEEAGSLGLRLFLVQLACFLPAFLCVFAVFMSSSRQIVAVASIGSHAHELSPKNPIGLGKNVGEEVLYDPTDQAVRLGDRHGKWLVLALLEKETYDDTGADRAIRAIPKVLPGVVYLP